MVAIGVVESKIMDANTDGECSGSWVAQSDYLFNIAPHRELKTESVFQIWATIILDFESGGTIEYQCELVYKITNSNSEPPPLEILVDVGYRCTKDLETLFDREMVIVRSEPTMTIWKPYNKDVIESLVSEKLRDNF